MNEKKTMFPPCGHNHLASGATRQDRINAIKEAINAGSYRIETSRLADSLLEDLLWEKVLRNRRPSDEKV